MLKIVEVRYTTAIWVEGKKCVSWGAPTLAVASLGAKRRSDRFLPLLTLAGVAAAPGVQPEIDGAGVLFGLGAAVAFGTYTLMAGRVGKDSAGIQGLALSVGVAAILLSPLSLPAIPKLNSTHWTAVMVSALLGARWLTPWTSWPPNSHRRG